MDSSEPSLSAVEIGALPEGEDQEWCPLCSDNQLEDTLASVDGISESDRRYTLSLVSGRDNNRSSCVLFLIGGLLIMWSTRGGLEDLSLFQI